MKKLFWAFVIATMMAASPALAARIEAKIDLSEQRMYVYKNGVLQYRWRISSGRKGYRTPTGTYRPTRMYKRYYSRKYDNAPMPYSIFFHGGYAIHGTGHVKRLGRPASHGCVRLHPKHASRLYSMVSRAGRKNTRISIRH